VFCGDVFESRMKLTISIVTFNNESVIRETLTSIEKSTLKLKQENDCEVIVVDNSSIDQTAAIISREFPWVTLIPSENIGFGAGHNKAIRKILGKSDYHLIMNPDVYFEADALENLLDFIKKDKNIGLVTPKLLYPDDQIQYTCRLLPTPFDLVVRRFIPGFLKPLFKNRLNNFEQRHRDYDKMMEAPNLSGCVMMIRSEVFKRVGLFDERFFVYLEDVDFTRRIHQQFKTVYYPKVRIYHRHGHGSYKKWKDLKYHVSSAIKYFCKWGWFFDRERKKINTKTIHMDFQEIRNVNVKK